MPIYLDNAATTRLDPRVLEAMLPYLTERFGNPASRTHAFGWEAEEAVETARRQVAASIAADPQDVVFVSGATEANHLALRGVLNGYRARGRHCVTSAIEHSSILETSEALRAEGFQVTTLGVDREGRIDLEELGAALREDTVLVSVMHGNNEVGTLQDLAAIGSLCRARHVLFHTDATQSFGRIPINVEVMKIDLLSASAHKIHGPKGCGALFVRRRSPRVALVPDHRGGGQERGLRSGTLNVPAIVGFGAAAQLMTPGGAAASGRAPRSPGDRNPARRGGREGERRKRPPAPRHLEPDRSGH
ncbi:MAG: cysteine desulfurase family protein [Candidatus Eisenbacteria bacterium]